MDLKDINVGDSLWFKHDRVDLMHDWQWNIYYTGNSLGYIYDNLKAFDSKVVVIKKDEDDELDVEISTVFGRQKVWVMAEMLEPIITSQPQPPHDRCNKNNNDPTYGIFS